MALRVMLPRSWVASNKPEPASGRSQGWPPWQGRGWGLAPRDRGPGAGGHYLVGHCYPFFFPRPTVFFGPLRVRAFVFVRWPFTGSPRRWRIPR